MPDRQDTIAAVATPAGKGGIGIVRVSGKGSLDIAKAICHIEVKPRQAHFCTFKDRQGRVIDRGVLIYFNAPNSFTGEDVVEFQGHGGQVVLNLLLKEALAHGARLARPGEFTERAYLNDRIDLIQAEAIADLIESVSDAAARSAARSLEGDFSRRINHILEQLVSVRAYVEGALDFVEEEIDFLKDTELVNRLDRIISELDGLLQSARGGRKLRDGTRVVIFGRPNVGKSSLLNRLAGADKAIVTEIAGTTRDMIEDTILIDGLSLNVVDTAGLREPEGPVEAEGIRRSLDEIKKAEVKIIVTEHEELGSDERQWVIDNEIPPENLIVLHNKIDLYGQHPHTETVKGIRHVYASMKTGEGVGLLRELLGRASLAGENTENLVLARERHIQSLMRATTHITAGLTGFRMTGQGEILAEDLKNTQKALGEITGEFHTEDLLGEIFSRFCIGK